MFQNVKKRAQRRNWPIMGYIGPNGGGKTAAMVWDTLPSLEAGRPVLGTVRLLDYNNPRECDDLACEADPYSGHYVRSLPEPHMVEAALVVCAQTAQDPVRMLSLLGEISHVHGAAHPLWIPLTDWQQVLDARGVDLLFDEITGGASSRDSSSLPSAVANTLVQLRRKDVTVRFSSPAWARADKILRECAQAATYCEGKLPKKVEDEAGQRQWRQRRLFRWRTYDATQLEDFDAGKLRDLDPITKDWHWGPKSPAFTAYDTYDTVLRVGTVTEAGTCMTCGKGRRREACQGHPDLERAVIPAQLLDLVQEIAAERVCETEPDAA